MKVCVVVLLGIAFSEIVGVCNGNCASNSTEENGTRVLSRRKRFLVFPDGSSLQLVFCVQTAAVIPIGDIFLYGNTAALAWTLPSDPKTLLLFKEQENFALRRGDMKKVKYINENGKVIASVPFSRPNIVNPAFAKRSVDSYKELLKTKMDRARMHERQFQRFLKKDLDDNLDFHRLSRVELYTKIEALITALGGDGRRCVLYKLCESQRSTTQGTFLQELLRVVFTLPKGKEFVSEMHKEYDEAHSHTDDCALRYPGLFCTQNHGYLRIGDIVWFGNTAALAWELPTDPQLFHIFKDHEKDFAQNRNGVSKLIYFLDQDGKVLSKVPYKRKPIVNPAFAKRSITSDTRKMLHENQKQQYDHLDTSSIDFHRMGRQSFYSHLEKFIKAIGWSGQECVLRLLCEFGKTKGVAGQGMFLEEIMRAIFTLPGSKSVQELYDVAHNSHGRCDELYRCEEYNAINI
ncbi:uncharacterized protein LOC121734436 [Aricia agestis]|uniref:uncharacterized protein LOC121734436 n=1 Tax=Aricia agestis TaxID=91739 RepID=UPI001C205757|nr:uncharacterized protein LOC121734436 [Aricia agestis]